MLSLDCYGFEVILHSCCGWSLHCVFDMTDCCCFWRMDQCWFGLSAVLGVCSYTASMLSTDVLFLCRRIFAEDASWQDSGCSVELMGVVWSVSPRERERERNGHAVRRAPCASNRTISPTQSTCLYCWFSKASMCVQPSQILWLSALRDVH